MTTYTFHIAGETYSEIDKPVTVATLAEAVKELWQFDNCGPADLTILNEAGADVNNEVAEAAVPMFVDWCIEFQKSCPIAEWVQAHAQKAWEAYADYCDEQEREYRTYGDIASQNRFAGVL